MKPSNSYGTESSVEKVSWSNITSNDEIYCCSGNALRNFATPFTFHVNAEKDHSVAGAAHRAWKSPRKMYKNKADVISGMSKKT
jgi:hypothetical protein